MEKFFSRLQDTLIFTCKSCLTLSPQLQKQVMYILTCNSLFNSHLLLQPWASNLENLIPSHSWLKPLNCSCPVMTQTQDQIEEFDPGKYLTKTQAQEQAMTVELWQRNVWGVTGRGWQRTRKRMLSRPRDKVWQEMEEWIWLNFSENCELLAMTRGKGQEGHGCQELYLLPC